MKVREGSLSVRIEVDVWWQEDDGHIHIASTDTGTPDFHTTVNEREGSVRCHRNLFMKLAEVLEHAGKQTPEWRHLKMSAGKK